MKARLARSRQIAEVLARNGWHALAAQAGLGAWLPSGHKGGENHQGRHSTPDTGPDMLVKVLQELGTTFVKLGQVLSTRRDVLPPDYCDALATLTDSTPTTPASVIRERITEELGAPVSELFPEFNDKPLGSASVGQVHAATRRDGQEVVVKVRKPGVREVVVEDLASLNSIMRALVRNDAELRELGLEDIVQAFTDTLMNEIDFTTEAGLCAEMGALFSGDEFTHVTCVDETLSNFHGDHRRTRPGSAPG